MRPPTPRLIPLAPSIWIFVVMALFNGCTRSYDETIAGTSVPIPKAMTRSADKPSEMSLLGFAAGHASFQGKMGTDEIVEFYKKELPARGWQSNMNLRSGGAMLAFTKEGKTLLIGVGKQGDQSDLTLTVGGASR
jgi:hypothetical protein